MRLTIRRFAAAEIDLRQEPAFFCSQGLRI